MEKRIKLPLRVRAQGEAIVVTDAADITLSYTYFEDEEGRRLQTKRVSKARAIEIAKVFARAPTDRIAAQEQENPPRGEPGGSIDLLGVAWAT